MADILIRGMKMPTHCLRDCPVCDCERMVCKADSFARPVDWTTDTVPDWCPLLPLPAGHGRLIDADDLIDEMRLAWEYDEITNAEWTGIREWLNHAPTIVPAEGGGEEC